MRAQQRLADGHAQLGDDISRRQPRHVEGDPPRQRIPIGVQTGGWEGDQQVSGLDAPPIDQLRAFDRTDDEPGDIVFAVRVEPGHFGGLSAEQRASVLVARRRQAFDDLHGHIGIEPAGGEIIEEEQRHRALDQDVVDAVIHEIAADRVVDTGHECHAQLGADAVGAGNEHRILQSCRRQREQPAERPDLREHTRCKGPLCQRTNPPDDFVAGVDVHS